MSDIVFDRMLFDYLEKKNDQSSEIARLSAEVERMRLTDEERAALAAAADLLIGSKPGAILRNLLERLHA